MFSPANGYIIVSKDNFRVWSKISQTFTGIIYNSGNTAKAMIYRVNGENHRLLGPAMVHPLDSKREPSWWYKGNMLDYQTYWSYMYEMFKDTKYETECLANLLGSNDAT